MKSHHPLFACILSIVVWNTQTINAQDQTALVSPYNGSTLLGSYTTQFIGLTMLVNPVDSKKNPAIMAKEGELNSNIYKSPESVSTYELYKSYFQVFSKADFDILLDCKTPDCNVKIIVNATYGYPHYVFQNRKYEGKISASEKGYLTGWAEYYLSVRKKTADATYYIMVLISAQRNLYSVDVLKVEEMAEGSVSLSPELLKEKIESEGKAVLDGIFFETGKAIIMEESNPALTQIANYLKENPGYQYYVVGHTDDTGNFDTNLALSGKRAEAVIEALNKRGVNTSNLSGHGVGPLSPAATNKSESGKSKNRRVELVVKIE